MVYLFILALALCWGPSFVYIKIALEELPPFTLLTIRIGFAALILLSICLIQRQKVFKKEHLKHFLFLGIFASGLPFFFVISSELYISSSLASIINGAVPLFVIPLAFLTGTEKVTLDKVLGVFLGVIGLLFIFAPGIGEESQDYLLGTMYMTGAALCYAISMVYAKVATPKMPSLVAPTGQLVISSLLFIPLCYFIDDPTTLAIPSPRVVYSILALSLLGTVAGFILYYKILSITGAATLSIVTLMFPLIGVFLGVIFLFEPITLEMILGTVLIFSGLIVTNPYIKSKLFPNSQKEDA